MTKRCLEITKWLTSSEESWVISNYKWDNHTEVIKQRLAAKTVIKNYNEINSTKFEYFKEKAGETKK